MGGFRFCSSYRSFLENKHYSSKIRGNACSSGVNTAEFVPSHSSLSLTQTRFLPSARRAETCITANAVDVFRGTAGALAGISAMHPGIAPCSYRCCCCELRCLSSTSWTWQEGKGQLLFPGVEFQSLFLEIENAQQLDFQTTHIHTAVQALRSYHCSHERIIWSYLFPDVYMWKMPQLSTFSPLAINHLPSTCPSSRNKLQLGCSLHKRQTKSYHNSTMYTHFHRQALYACIVIFFFLLWKGWYFSAG